jgi:undecaprenyl-diphosphatase
VAAPVALTKAFKLPSGSKLLLILAVVAAALGAVLATRWGRRNVWSRLVRAIQRSWANLREVASSPGKLTLLFGGSVVVTLAYVAALAASVQAFGGGVSVAKIGAVYLAASALAAAAPTPGGLGAIEAALVAGPPGVGMRPAAAVSAVLRDRLATYWLPVLPGWLSWHFSTTPAVHMIDSPGVVDAEHPDLALNPLVMWSIPRRCRATSLRCARAR